MLWPLLAAIALAGSVTASGTCTATVSITLTAHIVRPVVAVAPPPAVLVNRLEEPLERYFDTENRRAVAALRRDLELEG